LNYFANEKFHQFCLNFLLSNFVAALSAVSKDACLALSLISLLLYHELTAEQQNGNMRKIFTDNRFLIFNTLKNLFGHYIR